MRMPRAPGESGSTKRHSCVERVGVSQFSLNCVCLLCKAVRLYFLQASMFDAVPCAPVRPRSAAGRGPGGLRNFARCTCKVLYKITILRTDLNNNKQRDSISRAHLMICLPLAQGLRHCITIRPNEQAAQDVAACSCRRRSRGRGRRHRRPPAPS